MTHTYAGRPKYYCQTKYKKSSGEKCGTSILDEELEKLVIEDLRGSYEAYRMEMTNRETYLEQKQMYEQMIVELEGNVVKQRGVLEGVLGSVRARGSSEEKEENGVEVEMLTRELVGRYVEKVVVGKSITVIIDK